MASPSDRNAAEEVGLPTSQHVLPSYPHEMFARGVRTAADSMSGIVLRSVRLHAPLWSDFSRPQNRTPYFLSETKVTPFYDKELEKRMSFGLASTQVRRDRCM